MGLEGGLSMGIPKSLSLASDVRGLSLSEEQSELCTGDGTGNVTEGTGDATEGTGNHTEGRGDTKEGTGDAIQSTGEVDGWDWDRGVDRGLRRETTGEYTLHDNVYKLVGCGSEFSP